MQEALAGNGLSLVDANDSVFIVGRITHAVDAANAGDDDDISTAAE